MAPGFTTYIRYKVNLFKNSKQIDIKYHRSVASSVRARLKFYIVFIHEPAEQI